MDDQRKSTRTRLPQKHDLDQAQQMRVSDLQRGKKTGNTTHWPLGVPEPEEKTIKLELGPHDPTDFRIDKQGHVTQQVSPPTPEDLSQARKASPNEIDMINSLTAAQLDHLVGEIQSRIYEGRVAYGNVELAAMLGHKASQIALGRESMKSMSPGELVKFLLTDPNVKINISTREV